MAKSKPATRVTRASYAKSRGSHSAEGRAAARRGRALFRWTERDSRDNADQLAALRRRGVESGREVERIVDRMHEA
jgi:hypothetical protein